MKLSKLKLKLLDTDKCFGCPRLRNTNAVDADGDYCLDKYKVGNYGKRPAKCIKERGR